MSKYPSCICPAMEQSIGSLDSTLRNLRYRLFRNVAPLNAANDHFEGRELRTLAEGRTFSMYLRSHRRARACHG
jgi:hypothetical protein